MRESQQYDLQCGEIQSGSLEPATGERVKDYMKKDKRYEDAPEDVREALSSAKEIQDFLPPPEQLILKEDTKKVTILLSQKSIEFFKEKSKTTHVPYQQMIRKVLDNYTEAYSQHGDS
jgi:predicted DNA binding CopG/RHH family protein